MIDIAVSLVGRFKDTLERNNEMANPPGAARTAIIVDDESGVRESIALVLDAFGVKCIQAWSRGETVQAAACNPNALIVLDLTLGRSGGVQIMEDLAKVRFAGPIALISGHGQSVLDSARASGALRGLSIVSALPKPIRRHTLELLVNDVWVKRVGARIGVDVEEAVAQGRLLVSYEPKFDLQTAVHMGLEAIVGLQDGALDSEAAERFARSLSAGDYVALLRFAISTVLRDRATMADTGPSLRLSVPVRADGDVLGDLSKFVHESRHHLDGGWRGLVFDVTEADLLSAPRAVTALAEQLNTTQGVEIAIAGITDAVAVEQALNQCPVAELKIDRKVARGCSSELAKLRSCGTSAQGAKRMMALVTATGIDEPDDFYTVRRVGCQAGQGRLLGVPCTADDLAERRPVATGPLIGASANYIAAAS